MTTIPTLWLDDEGNAVHVVREGASVRTADAMLLLLCQDLQDLGAELSPWGAEVFARAAAALLAGGGTAFRVPGAFHGDALRSDLDSLADQMAASIGVAIEYCDGYVIRTLSEDSDDEDQPERMPTPREYYAED